MKGASYAVTGVGTFWGRELAGRLKERAEGNRVLALDLHRPHDLEPGVDFQYLDLIDTRAAQTLGETLRARGVESLVHLAFRQSPGPNLALDHALEVEGSRAVLDACAAADVARVVIPSTTMLYGPKAGNPNFLAESWPLAGHPHAHCVQNRAEVERLAAVWAEAHPASAVSLIRSCWALGARFRNYVTRTFERPVVSTCLGHDPLLQFIHEEDLLGIYEEAAATAHPGIFNAVGRGVVPLSRLLALAGKKRLPLPEAALEFLGEHGGGRAGARGNGDEASGFYDYLRYLWVADGELGWAEFGEPRYSTQEAWVDFVSSDEQAFES